MKECCRWTGEVEGYARRKCHEYAPQLQGAHCEDDLVQEAFLVFDKLVKRYADEVKSERHFMGIFKRSLRNRFWNMEREMKSARRRGCGGFSLGEHDHEVPDDQTFEPCLDDTPAVIQRMNARLGIDGNHWYGGRRFIKVRQKQDESPMDFLRRVIGGSESDLAIALAHMGLEEPEPCTC